MRRTADIETLPTALRVLAHEATHISLEAPPTEPDALADDADVMLGALTGADDAACVAGESDGTSDRTLTPAAGLPLSWSELDEWLEAS
jgi:hypothetical protein